MLIHVYIDFYYVPENYLPFGYPYKKYMKTISEACLSRICVHYSPMSEQNVIVHCNYANGITNRRVHYSYFYTNRSGPTCVSPCNYVYLRISFNSVRGE